MGVGKGGEESYKESLERRMTMVGKERGRVRTRQGNESLEHRH